MGTTEKKLWLLWQRLLTTTALEVGKVKAITDGWGTWSYGLPELIFATDMNIIVGVNHNIPVLRDIITQPKFVSGDITTNFIKDVYPNGFKGTIKPCL